MSLCDALRVRAGDVVSFVGAGGKTTAGIKIAMELADRDLRVLITTTTKIYEPVTGTDERLLLAEHLEEALAGLPGCFREAPIVILARSRIRAEAPQRSWMGPNYPIELRPRKLEGVPPDWIGAISGAGLADVVIVEADGAHHRLLKAPNVHEPVVPDCTSLVVPMADVEVLGKPIDEEHVHRPALLADLAGVPMGCPVSPEVLAIALGHPDGGLKGAPAQARVIPLLATRQPDLRCVATEKAVQMLLLSPRIAYVVQAHLRSAPVRWKIFTR